MDALTAALHRRLTRRVALRFFVLGLCVDGAVVLGFVANPEWAAYFYSGQFPALSRLILFVFGAGLLLTYRNFVRLLREEGQLRTVVDALASGRSPEELLDGLPAGGVRDRIEGLLARPEHASQADPAGRDAMEAREETHAGWAKYVTAVLTMLGLVGTFLGLMVAIDSIRGIVDMQDKEAFFKAVVGALDGMGTAFSTSLAGIFGAVVLGFEQLVFHFAQLSFVTRVQILIERVLGPRVEQRGSVAGLAVELHRFRQDLRAWRTDVASAGAELSGAAAELAGHVRTLADGVARVLEGQRQHDDRWRDVAEELATLRRVAVEENQTLLTLAGHRFEGMADRGDSASPVEAGSVPQDGAKAGGPEAEALLAELRRSSDILGHIYREMGLVMRTAANRLELKQTEGMHAVARVIQRMDAQQATAAEQIALLRSLLRYLGEDERKLVGVMGVLRGEAGREDAGPGGGLPQRGPEEPE